MCGWRRTFNEDSVLELTPQLVGPSETRNSGIIGEGVDLNLQHLKDTRQSTLLFNISKRLLFTYFRDPDSQPEMQLFGQIKRVAKQWLDNYLVCKGETYPAQLMYQELADMACAKIHAGITRRFEGEHPIRAVLDPYNPTGSSAFVNFYTSKASRWQTDPRKCHVNWALLDSDWEGEFCRVVEGHGRVKAYIKNQGLGLEVPYRYGSNMRKYIPDFIVQVDDGGGDLPEPDRGDQRLSGRRCEGKEIHHGHILDPRREQPPHLRALGVPGIEGCVFDPGTVWESSGRSVE